MSGTGQWLSGVLFRARKVERTESAYARRCFMVWSLAGSAWRAGRSHACLSVNCSGSAPSGGASPASSAVVGRNGSRLDDTI
eukprot:scaffold1916_cov123-Isochrysis_galbana.AAC.2